MHNRNYHDEGIEDARGWSAFVAGALIGAGIALLFAPHPGTELRGMLRSYANRAKDDLIDRGQEAWDTAVERGREYYEKGEEVVRDAGRSARDFAKQGQEAVKDAGRSAKDFAKQAQDVAREPGRSAL
jgi:gas vesicle protein